MGEDSASLFIAVLSESLMYSHWIGDRNLVDVPIGLVNSLRDSVKNDILHSAELY